MTKNSKINLLLHLEIDVYKKNKYIDSFDKKYSAFREYWDEHIDEINRQFERNFAGNNRVIVVHGRDSSWYELTPTDLKCFYNTFNGPVCDYDHWQYFVKCIAHARVVTKNRSEKITYISDEKLR